MRTIKLQGIHTPQKAIPAAELEQIKAEKEKDILLTERSKEIYRKLSN